MVGGAAPGAVLPTVFSQEGAQKILDNQCAVYYNISVRHEGERMTIDLRKYFRGEDLPGSGVLECQLDLSGMELGGVKPFCAPVRVRAELEGSPGSVELRGKARYAMTMPCDRCFKTTTQERETGFFHVLVRELSDEENDDGEFVVVPDETLDVDQLVTEDILLDLPSKFLCSPNCRGLCPRCGKDLNEGDCGCEREDVDPRLAVLKELL